jgi:hypothetical protein
VGKPGEDDQFKHDGNCPPVLLHQPLPPVCSLPRKIIPWGHKTADFVALYSGSVAQKAGSNEIYNTVVTDR